MSKTVNADNGNPKPDDRDQMCITKGAWYQMGKTTVMSGYRSRTICQCRREDDAALIAEAGTVHNETGYTPRQLLEQRDKLLKACEDIVNARDRAEPYGGMIFQQALNNVENAYRIVTN